MGSKLTLSQTGAEFVRSWNCLQVRVVNWLDLNWLKMLKYGKHATSIHWNILLTFVNIFSRVVNNWSTFCQQFFNNLTIFCKYFVIILSLFCKYFVNIFSTFCQHFVINLLCHQTNRQRKFLLSVVRPVHWMHSSEVDCCQDMTVSLAPSSGDSLIVALLNLADMSLWALLKLFLGSHLQYFWNKISIQNSQSDSVPSHGRNVGKSSRVKKCQRMCTMSKCLIEIQQFQKL